MKKMKKIVSALLAGTMAAMMLVGCGQGSQTAGSDANNAAQNSGNTEETQLTGTIEFWNDKLQNTEQSEVDKIFDSIKNLTGITVEPIAYPDTAAYQTAMQQSIREDSAPGLFTWWSGPQLETLVENDLVEDLSDLWDDYVAANGVSNDIKDALSVDGKVYAVPYSIIYNTMIYNKDLFSQYNLEVPETFDDFLNVCQTLKDNGITPILLKNDSWAGFIWFQALIASFEPQLYQDICDGTKDYTDPDVVKVMGIWQDMLDKGYFSTPMTIQDMEKSLASGSAAMMLEPNYEAGMLVKEYGMVAGENLGTFVLPSMNGDKKIIFYEVSPLCVAKASSQKDLAKEVLKKWFTKENQTVLTEVTDNVNTSQVETSNACVNEIISYTTDTDNYQMMLRYYENTPEEIRDVALNELMKFELGDAGADQVLQTIQDKADEVFGK
ncbi:MAG TPA: extracellular solute-binding protein [Candidatus Scybalocola faecipullorum]|nr:extracellular solute-binding protein [Candidatus Scybalocola faecipullorum]